MKKLISILLSLIMLISFTVPASASFGDVLEGAEKTVESFTDLYEDVKNEEYDTVEEDSYKSFQYFFLTLYSLIENLSEALGFENPFDKGEYQSILQRFYFENVIGTTLENPEFVAADNEATNVLANGD